MKKNTFWFTLIEVLTAIAIIIIIALWVTNVNFNTINDKQKSQILWQKFIWRIQTIKNYATTGFWVGSNLFTPKKWKIEITTWTGRSITSYLDAGWIWQEYPTTSLSLWTWESVSSIKCMNYFGTFSPQSMTWTVSIEFSSWSISLPLCPAPSTNYNVLQVQVKNWIIPTTLEVNTMNGVIQEL